MSRVAEVVAEVLAAHRRRDFVARQDGSNVPSSASCIEGDWEAVE